MKFLKLSIILFFLFANQISAQEKLTKEERLTWFKDAKLGIFIHWGYYGVNGIGAEVLIDVSASYQLNANTSFVVGVDNLLDAYPEDNPGLSGLWLPVPYRPSLYQ